MYFTSCAEVALALLSPEYPAIGTARALAEANTVAPMAAGAAKKAVTDPFSRIAVSHSHKGSSYYRPNPFGWPLDYQHSADAVLLKAADAVADETARLMGEVTAEATVISYRA